MRLDGWGVQRPTGRMLGSEEEARDDEWAEACVYMAGNSLGLQNRRAAEMVLEELDVWADRCARVSALIRVSSGRSHRLTLFLFGDAHTGP